MDEDASRSVRRVDEGTGNRFSSGDQPRDVADTDHVDTERDHDDSALRIAEPIATATTHITRQMSSCTLAKLPINIVRKTHR